MKVANSSFNKLNQDKGFNDRVSSCSDAETAVVCFVQDAECISEIVFDLAFRLNSEFVFCSNMALLVFSLLGV